MDRQPRYHIEWIETTDQDGDIIAEEVISMEPQEHEGEDDEYLVGEEIISSAEMNAIPNSLDQTAAENLIYMAQDGQVQVTAMGDLIEEQVEQVENADYNEHQYFECQVTEEVITDDWVQKEGEERVEIPVDQIGDAQILIEEDVPLNIDQDEYTLLRPYPCDFCSRRFRKKVSLMNHMVAHQNDRPHICNLCGARYLRKDDLINHFKIHAHLQDEQFDNVDRNYLSHYMDAGTPNRSNSESYSYSMSMEDEDVKPKIAKLRSARGHKERVKKEEISVEEEEEATEDIEEEVEEDDQQEYSVDDVEYTETVKQEKYIAIDPRKPFVCQQCGISFAREKALLSHSKNHIKDKTHECSTCSEVFWDAIQLHLHEKNHATFEGSNSEYEPENDFESESENDSKYGEFYCEICGMSFHRQDLLKRHTKTHIKKETYDCDAKHCCNVCGDTFMEALDLLAHAEVHARFQPFKCMLCGETFLEELTIKKHLNTTHASEMTPNNCILCGKLCKDSRSLMKHAYDHSREKNHTCSKCGKTFHNKGRLKRHMVSHRNKTVECEICREEFPDGRSLMNHRHSHSNSSGRLFPCNECGKTFGSRSSQQIHVRIHTGERPYGCRFCWKAFADGGTLRKHERIHTGEKPYACAVCPRAFNQRVVLREHIRSHHSAPDTKLGTQQLPYVCTVCHNGPRYATSGDIIQHLIEHSDTNTAMQRQPITGPRKYKRRRKLKPHELERMRNEKTSDVDCSDVDTRNIDEVWDTSTKVKRSRNDTQQTSSSQQLATTASNRRRKNSGGSDKTTASWQFKLINSATDETYNAVFQNLENALQNIDPLVVNNSTASRSAATGHSSDNFSATPSTSTAVTKPQSKLAMTAAKRRNAKQEGGKPRPKMIHTSKSRVAADEGKRKTRSVVTRRTEPSAAEASTKNSIKKRGNRADGMDLVLSKSSTRSKNQSFAPKRRLSTVDAINACTRTDIFDPRYLLEASSVCKELEKYNPDVVNDLEEILRSPIKPKSSSPQQEIAQAQNQITDLLQNRKNNAYDENSNDESEDIEIGFDPIPESEMFPIRDHIRRRSPRPRRNIGPSKRFLEFLAISPSKIPTNQKVKVEAIEHTYDEYEDDEDSDPLSDKSSEMSLPRNNEPFFECEMCSVRFSERAQLLDHVPVHI